MRRMLCFVLAGLMLAGLTANAWADQSVERATPFSDYRQSASDEYTVPPGNTGSTGNTGNTGTGNTQTTAPDQGDVSPGNADNPGADNDQAPDTGDVSPAMSDNPAGTTVHAPSSGLPFTGLNLLTVVLLGVLLVAAGLALGALARVRRRALAR